MKLNQIIPLILCAFMAGCAHKKPITQPVPAAPKIAPIPPKPKVRPIHPGDYILRNPEILPDGSVVCHRAIQVIDSKKKIEDVTVFQCR